LSGIRTHDPSVRANEDALGGAATVIGMKAYREVDIWIHVFLTSALVGGEWSASGPGRFTPGERVPGIHWIGGWVGPRTGMENVEKKKILDPTGTRTPTSRPSNP
jgi:hypothetical protein